jgi:hypothetical protein
MNPAQFGCGFELLRAQRPADDYFRISEVRFNSFVAGSLNCFHGGEILMQARGEPGRSVPEFEGMVYQREQLHKIKNLTTEDTEVEHIDLNLNLISDLNLDFNVDEEVCALSG